MRGVTPKITGLLFAFKAKRVGFAVCIALKSSLFVKKHSCIVGKRVWD